VLLREILRRPRQGSIGRYASPFLASTARPVQAGRQMPAELKLQFLAGNRPTKPRKNQGARHGAEPPGFAVYVPPTDKRTSNVRGRA
jgi:hypothetical protein